MNKKIRRFFFSVYVQDFFAVPLAKFCINQGVSANFVTLTGLVLSIVSGVCYLFNEFYFGSFLFFVALILDSTDGRVARGTNSFSKFGAILDSVADKVRSFFVALCLIISFGLDYQLSLIIFAFYIILPCIRLILVKRNGDFYDPTILFWDSTLFKDWFVKNGILGLYTGWERAVFALIVAPLTNHPIEIFIGSILLEQTIFIFGYLFCRNKKVGMEL